MVYVLYRNKIYPEKLATFFFFKYQDLVSWLLYSVVDTEHLDLIGVVHKQSPTKSHLWTSYDVLIVFLSTLEHMRKTEVKVTLCWINLNIVVG